MSALDDFVIIIAASRRNKLMNVQLFGVFINYNDFNMAQVWLIGTRKKKKKRVQYQARYQASGMI